MKLYDYGARNYDPAIGRWMNMDPVVDFERSPYNGFDNNPVFFSDPSGGSVTFDSNGVTADGEDAGAFYNAILGAQNNGIASFTPLGPIYDYTAYTTLPPVYLNYGNFGDNATMLRQHVYSNSPFYNYIWEQGRQRQLDSFNTMLDAFGLIPGIGEFADGLNAIIYAARGDKVNAAISTASMVPFLGWAAVSTKYAVKAEAKLLTQFTKSTIEDAVSLTMKQKELHIFANKLHPKPWLNELSTQIGGNQNVIKSALENANGKIFPNAQGVFNTPTSAGGVNFTIRGYINQGTPIINSIFIP